MGFRKSNFSSRLLFISILFGARKTSSTDGDNIFSVFIRHFFLSLAISCKPVENELFIWRKKNNNNNNSTAGH